MTEVFKRIKDALTTQDKQESYKTFEYSTRDALMNKARQMKPGEIIEVRYLGGPYTTMNDIGDQIWLGGCQFVRGEWRKECRDGQTYYIFLMEKLDKKPLRVS